MIDNQLCINRLIIHNRNFNMPSQSSTHHAPQPSQCNTPYKAPAAVHHAWERQTAGDAAGDAMAARSNMIYCSHLTGRPPRSSRPPGWSDMHQHHLDTCCLWIIPGNSRWSCHVLYGHRTLVSHSSHAVVIGKQRM